MQLQIGWLVRHLDGSFVGSLRTLTIDRQITLRPRREGRNSQGPSYDVLMGSGAKIGEGWETAKGVALRVGSPELAAPIEATMIAAEQADEWLLLWDGGDHGAAAS